jgi:excinuclease UvrABC nuclease subunit
MLKKDFEKLKLPETPGIYLFKKGKDLLYVGKATSLRQRVRSYFSNDLMKTRGRLLVDMIALAERIDFKVTDSVLEALILEAQYIKENQPKYNTKDKDNKSYNYVVITDEEYPRVLVVRGRNLEKNIGEEEYRYTFGPYPYGGELKEALKLVRKIFPFRDKCTPLGDLKSKTNPRPCFNRMIGLCPGVCTGEISKKDYDIQIKNIKMFFEGKKPMLLKSLEKQMNVFAKEKEFEKAGKIKRTIFALNHIQDVSLMKRVDSEIPGIRIEAYDIAHLSGKKMVGAMVVMKDGELINNLYRKFIIKGFDKANDPGALGEIIKRRSNHLEWGLPKIIVVDGNQVQLKRAKESFGHQDVLFCSVVKDQTHKAREILFFDKKAWEGWQIENNISMKLLEEQIIKINAEVHRFVITFHKKRRSDSFLGK